MSRAASFKFNLALIALSTLSSFSAVAHEHKPHVAAPVEKAVANDEGVMETISASYNLTIKPIFQKSCYDCHSSTTTYPWYSKIPGPKQLMESDMAEAKVHLDLSNGFPFKGHGTPMSDLEAIGEEVAEGEMPPWRYRIMHWNSGLTDDEKQKIKAWVDYSLKLLLTTEAPHGVSHHGH